MHTHKHGLTKVSPPEERGVNLNCILLRWKTKCPRRLDQDCSNEPKMYGGPQLSHQIQITHIKYKILTSKTRLNGQWLENENYVQFSLGLDPTAILFLHMVLSSGCFAATAEEMSTIATFVATAGKVSESCKIAANDQLRSTKSSLCNSNRRARSLHHR